MKTKINSLTKNEKNWKKQIRDNMRKRNEENRELKQSERIQNIEKLPEEEGINVGRFFWICSNKKNIC